MNSNLEPRFVIHQGFSKDHERVITLYLQDERKLTTDQWRLLYEAIEYLGQSKVEIQGVRYTFRQLYNEHIDQPLADEYLEQLLRITDLVAQGATLTATFAKQIAPILERVHLLSRNNPQSYLLFA